MKDNREALNEAFFKKDSYSEKIAKRMPAYEPITKDSNPESVFAVTDAKEMKKRLAGTFGAAFGDNNLRSMASKSIKTFPIIVSDNVEPETVLSLKKLMEEQYADYISLLVSNKVIDLSAYDTADADGETIAIQALDSISGTDFSSTRVANKAGRTGNITPDDVFANVPLYNLIRENSKPLKTGDALIDALLENALVITDDHIGDLEKYLTEANLDEKAFYGTSNALLYDNKGVSSSDKLSSQDSVERALAKYAETQKYDAGSAAVLARDELSDHLRGVQGLEDGSERYNKLTNTDIIVDTKAFNNALNRTIGDFLTDPKNLPIKERFEKASILLQSELITGSEFIDYCTMRLGIPMSKDVRQRLVSQFRRAKSLDRHGDYKNNIFFTEKEIKAIYKNEKAYGKLVPEIMKVKVGNAILAGVGGATAGAGAGLGYGLLTAVSLASPIGIGVLVGSAVGASAYLIAKLIQRRKKTKYNKVEGWERVESLIEAMDKQRADIISSDAGQYSFDNKDAMKDVTDNVQRIANKSISAYQRDLKKIDDPYLSGDDDRPLSGKEIDKLITDKVSNLLMNPSLAEGLDFNNTVSMKFSENYISNFVDTFNEVLAECKEDKYFRDSMLAESITTNLKMKTKYITKQPGKDLLIAPEFSARSAYAYGSTEIDPKLAKDRKYNQPLLMTIRFKERFSDGKFSDNELTAVIGILGKVIRVPSEEMKYILAANADGETIKGAFNLGTGDLKNAISDLLSITKINKDVKELPQSAEIWRNLEKVAALAVSNKMAGRKSNNIANAHIIFSEKEIDEARLENGVDYKRDMKAAAQLMKRYSAFTLMIADDAAQRVYVYNDVDDISWNVVPYNAIIGKDSGDQLTSALARLGRMM